MANEFVITHLVDKEAFGQLERLRTDMKETTAVYVQMAERMAAESASMPKGFEELGNKARGFIGMLGEMNSTQNKLVKIQERQLQVLKQVSAQLDDLSGLSKLNRMFDELAKTVQNVNALFGAMGESAKRGASGMQEAAQYAGQASDKLKTVEVNCRQVTETIRAYDSEIMKLNKDQVQIGIEMDTLKKVQKSLNDEFAKGKISVSQYTDESAKIKKRQDELKASMQQNQALIRNHATAVVSTKGSYYELNAAMLELQKRYKGLDEATRESAFGQNLVKQANDINAKLKQIDAQFGNYQRNVGNYSSAWNGLGMSIQQIGRELPSLAMGWNTFFLAISNNLPILTDELKRAKEEYKSMTAQGQEAVPVWKQVVKSIVSWQTALTVGITILSMYGKDIINWVSGLTKQKKAMEKLVEQEKELNEVRLKGAKNAQDEVVKLKLLYGATQDASRSMNERKKAVDALQKEYPKYFGNMTDEEVLAGKAADSYTRLAQSIIASARARAARDKMTENERVILDNEEKINDAYVEREKLIIKLEKKQEEYNKRAEEGFGSATAKIDARRELRYLENDINKIDEEIANYRSIIYETNKLQQELEKNINIGDLLFNANDGNGDDDDGEKYAAYLKKIGEELASTQIELMEESREKERAQVEADYAQRMAEITGNTQQEIALRKNLEELKAKELAEVDEKWEKQQAEALRNALRERLGLIEGNSQQELDERLRLQLEVNELMRQAEVAEAKKKGEDVILIEEKYAKMRNDLVLKNMQERMGLIEKSADEELNAQEMAVMKETNALKKSYAAGKMDREAYEQALYDTGVKYSKLRLETLVKEAEEQLKVAGISEEQSEALKKRIEKLKEQLEEVGLDDEIDKNAERLEDFNKAMDLMESTASDALGETGKLFEGLGDVIRDVADDGKVKMETLVDSIMAISDGLASVMNDMYEARIEKLDEEQEANEDAYDKEVERIEKLQEQGAISAEEAEARKRAAEDKTKQKEEEIAKRKAELQQKQANWDKANSIIQATIATALAVTKSLPNLILAALVGAMGAAQIAVIAAQQVPKYRKGTKDHPGGWAVVGDGGKKEAVVTDEGVWATPNKPTLVDLPRHAQVIPDIKMLTDRKGIGSEYVMLERMMKGKDGGVTVHVEGDNSMLEKRMGENTKQLKDIRKLLRKNGRVRDREMMRRRVV